jgi:hypothetical protein
MATLLSKDPENYAKEFITKIISKLYSQEQYLGFDYNESIDKSLLKGKTGVINELSMNHPEI